MLAVGNDCGPMHIADAVQIPTVVLFGPTSEVKNGPLARGTCVSTEIGCRPCQFTELWDTCTDPQCMTELSVGTVLTAVESLLSVET